MTTVPQIPSPTRISVFNHKGGVGKTTITLSLASALAERGFHVLLADTDPQCNLTSYLFDDAAVDELLDMADTPMGRTIWSGVRPISEAVGGIVPIKPLRTSVDRLFLLPGDIQLSQFETDLAEAWAQCLQRKAKGFRGTSAISDLIGYASSQVGADFVFYDSGPNMGPLNRSILLDCDYFIVPVACDLFSLRALKTLGRTLSQWIMDWKTISDLAPEETSLLTGRPQFLGYIPGGFRVYGGLAVKEQSHFLSRLDKEVHSQIISILRDVGPDLVPQRSSTPRLGEIPNSASLVTASQREGRPLWRVKAGTSNQRTEMKNVFYGIAKRVESAVKRANRD